MDAVAAALDAAAELLGGNREFSQRRQSVIDANAELRERELIKMARLAAALTARAASAAASPAPRPGSRRRPASRCSASASSSGPPARGPATSPSCCASRWVSCVA